MPMMRRSVALCAVVAATLLSGAGARRAPLWVDLDNSAGLDGVRDVDDALALIQLLNSPEVEVVGISTSFGNAGSEETYAATKALLERFFPEYVPKLYKGASGPGDFAKSPMTDALGAAMRKYANIKNFHNQLEYLALGPLTNLAALVSQEEHAAFADDGIWRLTFVGGRKEGLNFTVADHPDTLPDLNFEKDVPAAKKVLSTAIMMTMVGFEPASKLPLTLADLEVLASTDSATANWVSEVARPWLEFWKGEFKVDYFNPFDCLAVLQVTQPKMVKCINRLGWTEEGPSDKVTTAVTSIVEGDKEAHGIGVSTKHYLLTHDSTIHNANQVIYCYAPAEGAKDMILQRLIAPAHTESNDEL